MGLMGLMGLMGGNDDSLSATLDEVSEGTHGGPEAWVHEGFGEEDLAVVGYVHRLLDAVGFCLEGRLAAAEGVHQELVDAGLEEAVQAGVGKVEGAGKVEGELGDVCPEVELLFFACGVGDCGAATGVCEGWRVDVCDVSHLGKEEGYLHVFTAVGVGIEELRVVVHGLPNPVVSVE